MPEYGLAMVAVSLDAAGHSWRQKDDARDRPQKRSRSSQTRRQENQNWPCRELMLHRTPICLRCLSRLGDAGTQIQRANIRLNLNGFDKTSRRNRTSLRALVSFRRHCHVVQSNRRSRSALARCTKRTKVYAGPAGVLPELGTSCSRLHPISEFIRSEQ